MPLPTRTLDRQIWEMYKKAEASFWTAEEVDLIHDHKVCLVAPRTHGRVCLRVVLCRPHPPSPIVGSFEFERWCTARTPAPRLVTRMMAADR